MAETIYFERMLPANVLEELCNFIDLNWHVVVDLDDHADSLGFFEVDGLKLAKVVGCFLLVDGRVDDKEGDDGFSPQFGDTVEHIHL